MRLKQVLWITVILAVNVIALPKALPVQGAAPQPSTEALPRKVMVVVFDPVLSDGKKLTDSMKWHKPSDLVADYIAQLENLTRGRLQYDVATTIERNEPTWLRKVDGFQYTEETYLDVILRGQPHHEPDIADYTQITDDPVLDVCGRLNRGEIDELWLIGGPWFGFYESRLAGPGAFWYNSPPLPGTTCKGLLPIMGFSYKETFDLMLHSFGHRVESTLMQLYGGWAQNQTSHNWERFALVGLQSPDFEYSGCGSIHYPPNATRDGDYSNDQPAMSTCSSFRSYPDIGPDGSRAQLVGCEAWDCSHRGFMHYWLSHVPASSGVAPDNHSNDWWQYIAVPDLVVAPYREMVAESVVHEPASFSFEYAGPSSGFVIDVATDSQFTQDTLPGFASGPASPVVASEPDTWDGYRCGHAMYWRVNSSGGVRSTAQRARVQCTGGAQIFLPHLGDSPTWTITVPIQAFDDDAGPSPNMSCDYHTYNREVYFGECPDGTPMTSGFRFDNVPIRRGARIVSAKMKFTVDTYDGEALELAIHAEPTGNSRWFKESDSPGDRPLSTAAVPWSIGASESWFFGDTVESPDLRELVQVVVSLSDWQSGNAMTFLVRNDGQAVGQFRHRRVYGFDRSPEEAARLVVTVTR